MLPEAINKTDDVIISLDNIIDCRIDGKKVDIICDEVNYKVMFTNKNLAELFFNYIKKE